jgi:hypothetical protein
MEENDLCDAANVISKLNNEFFELQNKNEILKKNIKEITKIYQKPEVKINSLEEWNNYTVQINNLKNLIICIHNSDEFKNIISQYGYIDLIWRCFNYAEEENKQPDYNNYKNDRLYYPILQSLYKLTNNLNNNWILKRFEDIITICNKNFNIIVSSNNLYNIDMSSEICSKMIIDCLIEDNEGINSETFNNFRYFNCVQCKKNKKLLNNIYMLCLNCFI